MKTKLLLTCSMMMGMALALSGCGKKVADRATENAIETSMRQSGAENAQVDISNGGMKLQSDEGEMEIAGEGGSASIPADFPKDVFVDTKAKVQMAMKTPEAFVLTLVSNGSLADTAKEYDDKIKAQGWKQDASMDMGKVHTYVYKKEDRGLTVMASSDDSNAITVNLTVEARK